jgi:hypothetical protein
MLMLVFVYLSIFYFVCERCLSRLCEWGEGGCRRLDQSGQVLSSDTEGVGSR